MKSSMLDRNRWTVMDGAMGTRVEDLGFEVRQPLWGSGVLALEAGLEIIRRIHAEYVDAGAELLIANTHNASRASCAAYLAGGHPLSAAFRRSVTSGPNGELALLEAINETAVRAARAAARPDTRVAACLMSPDRPYAEQAGMTAEQVDRGLVDQAAFLDAQQLDLMIFEMLSTDADVEGAARVLSRLATPTAAGLTCGFDGRTHGGVDPVEAAERLVGAGASVVFVQCTHHDAVTGPLRRLFAELDPKGLTVGAYANAGRAWTGDAWRGGRISPQGYAARARDWLDAGARIVGGCCGTGPEHIQALAALKAGPPPPDRS